MEYVFFVFFYFFPILLKSFFGIGLDVVWLKALEDSRAILFSYPFVFLFIRSPCPNFASLQSFASAPPYADRNLLFFFFFFFPPSFLWFPARFSFVLSPVLTFLVLLLLTFPVCSICISLSGAIFLRCVLSIPLLSAAVRFSRQCSPVSPDLS